MGVSSHLFKAKVLVAGVASACALPALAQLPPEILIYGRVNVSFEHITVSSSSNTALLPNESNLELVDNSSRIGVRGKKELTRGLAAIFQVESRVKLDDSEGSVFASRDSYAGLQGGFGTLRAGRTIGPVYYATYDYISLHNHDTGTSSDALLAGTVVGNQGFMNNTLWYTSPKFGPYTVDVAYSLLGEARTPGLDQPRHLGLVGAYDQGPLHLAASYATTENTTDLDPGIGARGDKQTAITVGGLYDFKSFVIGALYENATTDLLVGDADRDYFRIAVMMPVAQHEFHLNYGWVDSDATNAGAKQYTLAYNYNITKQTKVYAFYTVVDNEAAGTFGFRQPSTGAVAGADFKSFALGFRHNF